MATKKVELNIEGMHCGSCALGIQMLLENTDGVINSSADYETKSGKVEYDEEKINLDKIIETIHELGYTASPK